MNLEEAISFVKEKHFGQKRIQGTQYYTHPIAVYNMLKENGFDEEYLFVGLFHDLLEDTDTTYEEILSLTNKNIADAVLLLTKNKGYIMDEYISRINTNNVAKIVKLADRIHNLREGIFANKKFQEKYILETEKYFLELSKNTIFENDLNIALSDLKNNIKSIT